MEMLAFIVCAFLPFKLCLAKITSELTTVMNQEAQIAQSGLVCQIPLLQDIHQLDVFFPTNQQFPRLFIPHIFICTNQKFLHHGDEIQTQDAFETNSNK